jgi:hypothetical protein
LAFFFCASRQRTLQEQGATMAEIVVALVYLTLSQVAAKCPGRPHKNTVTRWCSKGLHGERLHSVKFGGKRLVRSDWLADFITRLTEASPDVFQGDGSGSISHQIAEVKLDAMGV